MDVVAEMYLWWASCLKSNEVIRFMKTLIKHTSCSHTGREKFESPIDSERNFRLVSFKYLNI